jgi:hypothetical protein
VTPPGSTNRCTAHRLWCDEALTQRTSRRGEREKEKEIAIARPSSKKIFSHRVENRPATPVISK